MQDLPLNGFYESTTPKNSRRRCVNLIPINEPSGSLSQNMLECPSGITGPMTSNGVTASNVGTVSSQVFEFQNNNTGKDVVFCVQNQLIATDGDSFSQVAIPNFGANIPNMIDCRFAASESKLVALGGGIVGGSTGCAVEFDSSLSPTVIDLITDFSSSPHPFRDIAFLGGRFIYMSATQTGTHAKRCYYSEIGFSEPDPTNFFQPDVGSTDFRGLHVINANLWLFDADSAYLFSLTSSVSTPFTWQRSATLPIGLLGPQAKCEAAGGVFFIGRRRGEGYRPFAMNGSSASEIGTPAVNYAIENDVDGGAEFQASKIRVFTYTDKGREFVVFKTLTKCFVFSVTDKRWFERENPNGEYWEILGAGRADGQHTVMIGSEVTKQTTPSTLTTVRGGRLNEDIGTELGEAMPRFVDSAPFNANNQTMRLSELEPVCEVDGSSVEDVYLSVSKDYGESYGVERSNAVSTSTTRNRFLNMGIFRQAVVVRVRFLSEYPVKIVRLLGRLSSGVR